MNKCPICGKATGHAHFSYDIREYIVTVLAEIYRLDMTKSPYYAVADICDNKLDKSGALLGDVREKARELNKETR